MTVVGPRLETLFPSPELAPLPSQLRYDRHARLFGDAGQAILADLKAGIIGLGGAGSLLNQSRSRFGVGHIVAVDCDRVDITNLPRLVGASLWDVPAFLRNSHIGFLANLAQRFARHKVHVAQRIAKQANPDIHDEAIFGNLVDSAVAESFRDADSLFLAADSFQAGWSSTPWSIST
jgi:molybdopterin/thiamine biosynthesis adenylyltransferase